MAKHHGAPKDDESIKHSDVLVEDPEVIEKHAKEPVVLKKFEKKEPEVLEKLKKEPEVLEKLEKFFVEVLEAEEIADKAAGGDGAVLNKAGGA